MSKSNLVAKCFVVTFVYDNHVMIKPIIYSGKPKLTDERMRLREFSNYFDVKKYITANIGNEIKVRLAA